MFATLGPTDSISGVATNPSKITYTFFVGTLVAGVPSFKVGNQGQLSNSVATIVPTAAGQQTLVKKLVLVNTDAVNEQGGIIIYANGTGVANQITPTIKIPPNGYAILDEGLRIYDQNNAPIT